MVSEDAANNEDYNETLKYSLYHIADKISSLWLADNREIYS